MTGDAPKSHTLTMPAGPARLMLITVVLGLIAGLYLTLLPYDWFEQTALFGAVCGGRWGDCKGVVESAYGEWLGIPVSVWGVAFYVTVGLCAWTIRSSSRQKARPIVRFVLLLAAVACLIDVYLAYLMFTKIERACPFCLATYGLNVVMLIGALWMRAAVRRIDAPTPSFWSNKRLLASILIANPIVLAAGLFLSPSTADTDSPTVAADTPDAPYEIDPEKLDRLRRYLRGAPKIDFSNFDGQPIRGSEDAPTTIVVFEDFLCGECRSFNKTLETVRARRPGQIRVVFINYPLDSTCNDGDLPGEHPGACILAQVGEAAHAQGMFWPFHDFVLADAINADPAKIGEFLGSLGIDPRRYNADVVGRGIGNVRYDIDLARQVGIKTTPSIVLNRRLLVGALDVAALEAAIDETLYLEDTQQDE